MSSKGEFKEILEDAPALCLLKGNIQKPIDLVLVTSPIDALVHYEKTKDDDTCYVHVNAESKEKIEGPLLDLIEKSNCNHVLLWPFKVVILPS